MKNPSFSLLTLVFSLFIIVESNATSNDKSTFPLSSYLWDGTFGDWFNPAKWIPNGVPGINDDVTIAGGDTHFNTNVSVQNLYLDQGQTSGSGNLTVLNSLYCTAGNFGDESSSGIATINGPSCVTSGGGSHVVFHSTLSMAGVGEWTGGEIRVAQSGILRIPSNQVFSASYSGTQALTNPYGGVGTFDNQGIFQMTNNGTLNVNIGFTNSGTLKGNGTIAFNSTFTNTGSYSPGLPVGQLTIARSSLSNNTLNIDISGPEGPGTGHDRLNVTGNFTTGGILNVSLLNGYTPAPGTSFEIVLATGTVTGTFGTLNLPTIPEIGRASCRTIVKN